MALAALISCANPALDSVVPAAAPVASSAASPEAAPAAGTSVYSLTLAWNAGGSRSILPASYPLPVSYDITLHPAVGSDVTRSLAATTCTFDGLQAVAYAVSVSGRDSGGNVVVSGSGSADMRAAAPVHATIVLNYSSSGGTGQMHLTFSCATAVTGTPTMTLVSPSGVVSSGIALSGSSPTFSYTNDSAAAGTWKLFSAFASGTKSAMKLETVLVLRNIDTVGTLSIAAGDFSTTLVAVSGLALNASTMTLAAGGATGSLAATVSPAGASNQLVAWTSSTPDVASVDQNGTVTPVAAGTATITAKSVDHPAATASCAVTVLATYGVTYDTNGATGGTSPAAQTKVQGTGLTLSANSGSLVRSGYIFAGWNTAANGGGTDYSVGATYSANTALALYSKWLTNVTFAGLSANGTSGTMTTTVLTLSFNADPSTLAPGDITVTGATKGDLSGTGITRTLGISAITVANGQNVSVALSSPAGFTMTPASRVVAINYYSLGLSMVSVPAGTFQRDATPANTSYVSAFRMGATEITRAQFLAVLKADPSVTLYSSGTSDPVQNINWYQAIAFCNKLSIAEGRTPVYSVSGVDFATLAYAGIPTSRWSGSGRRWERRATAESGILSAASILAATQRPLRGAREAMPLGTTLSTGITIVRSSAAKQLRHAAILLAANCPTNWACMT